MVSPRIDESMVLGILDVPVNMNTVPQLQSGAILSTVDAWDRNIQRGPFVDIMAVSFNLHSGAGRLQTMISIRDMLSNGDLDVTKLDDAIGRLVSATETHRNALLKHMELVSQCPVDEDQIH
jgi:hypothetical protein